MGGVQCDVVARPAPEKSGSRQQVVYLERALGRKAERVQVQLQPPRLRMMGVEVDDDEYRVGYAVGYGGALTGVGRFAIGDEIVIVDIMDLQTPVALQRCVFAADAIDQCNQPAQGVGA